MVKDENCVVEALVGKLTKPFKSTIKRAPPPVLSLIINLPPPKVLPLAVENSENVRPPVAVLASIMLLLLAFEPEKIATLWLVAPPSTSSDTVGCLKIPTLPLRNDWPEVVALPEMVRPPFAAPLPMVDVPCATMPTVFTYSVEVAWSLIAPYVPGVNGQGKVDGVPVSWL